MKSEATPGSNTASVRWTPFYPRAGCRPGAPTSTVRFEIMVGTELNCEYRIYDILELEGIESDIERWFAHWITLTSERFAKAMPQTARWVRIK